MGESRGLGAGLPTLPPTCQCIVEGKGPNLPGWLLLLFAGDFL